MTSKFHHEEIFRGREAMQKVRAASVHICGAGALGSNLALNLARLGVASITVIDMDRVEEHNVGTQIYSIEDVGAKKAELVRNILFREVGLDVAVHPVELTEQNMGKLLRGARIVIDTFDNSKSRGLITEYCKANKIECLHAGVNDGYGEVVWNEKYLVPNDAGLDVCDYPLSRNLILLVVALASESVVRFITQSAKESYSITLGDFAINEI